MAQGCIYSFNSQFTANDIHVNGDAWIQMRIFVKNKKAKFHS